MPFKWSVLNWCSGKLKYYYYCIILYCYICNSHPHINARARILHEFVYNNTCYVWLSFHLLLDCFMPVCTGGCVMFENFMTVHNIIHHVHTVSIRACVKRCHFTVICLAAVSNVSSRSSSSVNNKQQKYHKINSGKSVTQINSSLYFYHLLASTDTYESVCIVYAI